MPVPRILRSPVARVLRPLLAALDRRLEQLAARLELHTSNLAEVQRREIARIDERLTLDVAVVSEHLVGIERLANRVTAPAPGRVVIALPGEPLVLPDGAVVVGRWAPAGDGTWVASDRTDDSTLRVASLAGPAPA